MPRGNTTQKPAELIRFVSIRIGSSDLFGLVPLDLCCFALPCFVSFVSFRFTCLFASCAYASSHLNPYVPSSSCFVAYLVDTSSTVWEGKYHRKNCTDQYTTSRLLALVHKTRIKTPSACHHCHVFSYYPPCLAWNRRTASVYETTSNYIPPAGLWW